MIYAAYMLMLTLSYCYQRYICTVTPSHLLLLQLQQLQLRIILNIESIVMSMMHLSPKSLTADIICIITEEFVLLLTLHCANYTATNSALRSPTSDCY